MFSTWLARFLLTVACFNVLGPDWLLLHKAYPNNQDAVTFSEMQRSDVIFTTSTQIHYFLRFKDLRLCGSVFYYLTVGFCFLNCQAASAFKVISL